MEMTSTRMIPAPIAEVWNALNDPEALKLCVPGCESIEATEADQFLVAMAVKIGPVSARFKGKMGLSDVQPLRSYAIGFEGQGGVAGFAKGSATVQLVELAAGTELHYSVKAQVGGKIAQLGSRLIDSSAKKMADEFFTRFVALFDQADATA